MFWWTFPLLAGAQPHAHVGEEPPKPPSPPHLFPSYKRYNVTHPHSKPHHLYSILWVIEGVKIVSNLLLIFCVLQRNMGVHLKRKVIKGFRRKSSKQRGKGSTFVFCGFQWDGQKIFVYRVLPRRGLGAEPQVGVGRFVYTIRFGYIEGIHKMWDFHT